jgi:putative endonuclease
MEREPVEGDDEGMQPDLPAHLVVGKKGEDVATRYLIGLGYRLIDRNVRLGSHEIDIIVFDPVHAMMAFVEVKTRVRSSDAYPIHTAVDSRKRRCISQAVARWVTREKYDGPGRIDVVCVSGNRVTEHIMDLGSDFF